MNTETIINIEAKQVEPAKSQEPQFNQPNFTDSSFTGQAYLKKTSPLKSKMLFRHPTDKMMGGVCGGLAEYTGIDAVLLRAGWVILTVITGGGGLLAYLALWLFLPTGSTMGGQIRPAALEFNERQWSRAATVLIALGALWLLSNIGFLPWIWGTATMLVRTLFWPALLIGTGYLLMRGNGKEVKFNWQEMGSRFQEESGKLNHKINFQGKMRNVRQGFPLKRSVKDRIVMGVCGGVAKRLGIDSNLVRLMWAALSFATGGTALVVYILAGLFLPEEGAMVQTSGSQMINNSPVEVKIVDGSATQAL